MRNSVAHLFLRVVRGLAPAQRHQRRRRAPAFYVVNALPQEDGTWALPWPAPELLAWAWQRWDVEVWLREMKSDAGVGAAPCWTPTATVGAAPWQAWASALCVLAADRAWGYDRHPATVRPAGLWWGGAPRWSLATLWRGDRLALRGPVFHPGWAGGGTWAAKEDWLHHLDTLLDTEAAA